MILAIKGGIEVADVEVVGQQEKEGVRGMVAFWYLVWASISTALQTMV